jgi:pyruvate formate lyase activating enzyme
MRKAELYIELENQKIKCNLCNHYCILADGETGKCSVRRNIDGTLFTLSYGKASGLAIDPIEKKPFYHFYPKSRVLSFGTPGCNFTCKNCQNFHLSQVVKDLGDSALEIQDTPIETIVKFAKKAKVDAVAYTYSEPTIFFEYAKDVITAFKQDNEAKNMKHIFISNGFMSQEAINDILENNLLDAINIDLKFINNALYKKITDGSLRPVLKSIKAFFESKVHVELINLIIPGLNDDSSSIRKLIDNVLGISDEIPIHFSRFYPAYKLKKESMTSEEVMISAYELAKSEGIKYPYLGNIHVPNTQNTYCPKCNNLLITRSNNNFSESLIVRNKCIYCGHKLYLKQQ